MAQATHDLSVKTGEYQDRQTGQTKGRWLRIGTAFQHDDGGISIKLDCVPVGQDWDGWVSMFPRDQNQSQQQMPPPQNYQQPQGYAQAHGGQMPPQQFNNARY
jgi:hypothetical protein